MILDPKILWRASIAVLLFAAAGCETSKPSDPAAKVEQADDYACARFMAFEPAQCDRAHCDADPTCARLYEECAESGGRGGGDGCGGTCPTNDYCTGCGVYSRCANYYCGDCPTDPCNGDGCNSSCCGSSTYWCCDA